jgi:hypothetical protein
MAFVSVPKDLNKIKTKVALNLTKRQIISFSIGAIIGFPVYWKTRLPLGNDLAIFLMIGCILPFFFAAIFEKDGIVFEKYMSHIIKQKYIYPKVRLYKTENFYEYLNSDFESEVRSIESQKYKESRKTVSVKSKGTK